MPAYLNCDQGDEGRNINMRSSKYPPPPLGFIFDFKSPLRQSPSYKPVFGLLAPHSESALFSRNRPTCAGLLKEQFWTLSGSLKVPVSLKVLGSLKVPHNAYVTPESCY